MPERSGRRRLGAILAVAGVGALVLAALELPVDAWAQSLLSWLEGQGGWAVVVFVAVYALATVVFVPTWILSVGGGILFGVLLGLPIVLLAAMTGATLAFLLGRTLLRKPVERWVERHPRLRAVDREIERRGWLLAALLRLSPLVPYNVLNYVLGLTSLSLRGYLLSLFAMLPVLTLYVTIGEALGRAGAREGRERTTAEWVVLAVGILATLVVTTWLGRVATRTLPPEGGS